MLTPRLIFNLMCALLKVFFTTYHVPYYQYYYFPNQNLLIDSIFLRQELGCVQFSFFSSTNIFILFLFKPKKITDTLIPEEFHIVSNTGVSGLECYDEWVLWYILNIWQVELFPPSHTYRNLRTGHSPTWAVSTLKWGNMAYRPDAI